MIEAYGNANGAGALTGPPGRTEDQPWGPKGGRREATTGWQVHDPNPQHPGSDIGTPLPAQWGAASEDQFLFLQPSG